MDLTKLRAEIDELDAQWVEILAKRFAVTRQVGELKASSSLPSVDPARETAQFARLQSLAESHGVPPALVTDVLRLIIDEVVREHRAISK